MKSSDIFLMCIRNLLKRKTRTLLTVIGVIIGICALILMISLGIGLNSALRFMVTEWEDLTLIEVNNYGVGENGEQPPDLTDDVLASFLEIEHVKAVSPFYYQLYIGEQLAVYSGDYAIMSAPFVGVYMDSLEDFGYKLIDGRWKEEGDPANTVVFGTNTGAYMYDYVFEEFVNGEYDDMGNVKSYVVDALADEFRIIPMAVDYENWQWPPDYSFIGLETSPSMEYDSELNVVGRIEGNWREWYTMDGILIDVSCINEYIKMYNEINPDYQYSEFNGVYSTVKVRVDDMDNVTDVEKELKGLGYQTYYDGKAREQMKSQLVLIQILLSSLALVSIVIATLNIANTMITAIIERTKEIGIMKVLGCEIKKIHTMFLGEAAIIGFIGGAIGVALSFVASFIFNSLLTDVMISFLGGENNSYAFPEGIMISQIPIWLVAASLAFSTLVGVIAGIYPAHRSTKISALSAITNE